MEIKMDDDGLADRLEQYADRFPERMAKIFTGTVMMAQKKAFRRVTGKVLKVQSGTLSSSVRWGIKRKPKEVIGWIEAHAIHKGVNYAGYWERKRGYLKPSMKEAIKWGHRQIDRTVDKVGER